jgi:hypothetical protein
MASFALWCTGCDARRPRISLECQCAGPNRKLRLTRRPNQGHIAIIADIVKPAPGNRQRVFRFLQDSRSRKFQFVEFFSLHFLQFVDGHENGLTRRANQGHNDIIAKPARRNPLRVFLLSFSNRTAAAHHDATSPNARRTGVEACRRPSL